MQLTSIGNIRDLFMRHGFEFTKSLGQNFLINPAVCPKIAEKGGAAKGVFALEIGTGIGVLTKELALRCDKVLAVEIDAGLKPILEETLGDFNNIKIIYDDVLKLDLEAALAEYFGDGDEIICCANLPYYITSPVIMKLLEEKLPLKKITVMVQKEAGERLTAPPGERECGSISAAVRYYGMPEKLFSVSRGSFMPAPKVDSSVIGITPYGADNPNCVENEPLYFDIVKTVFSQRRKQIINPLSDKYKIGKERLSELLQNSGISPSLRAERLSMNDFSSLYNIMNGIMKNEDFSN